MRDLLVNLLASVVAGTAVWLAQRLLRYRRLVRKRAFFGLDQGADCQLAVARHAASPHELSVHRRDVAALVELATIARECGSRADLVPAEGVGPGIGRVTEFCVGGPFGNPRTAAHLRSMLPGVRLPEAGDAALPVTVGATMFRREPGRSEYVLLARAWGPAGGRPVFIVGGQTAATNLAAVRFLVAHHRQLQSRYGATERFCLVLRVLEPGVYGSDFTEVAADVTADAFTPADPAAALPTQPTHEAL